MTPDELEKARAMFCFKNRRGDPAGPDDYEACTLAPGHDGSCILSNARAFENRLAAMQAKSD